MVIGEGRKRSNVTFMDFNCKETYANSRVYDGLALIKIITWRNGIDVANFQ